MYFLFMHNIREHTFPIHVCELQNFWQCIFGFLQLTMLKLKLQYFGHLMRRVDSLEKTLMLGGIGGRRKGDDRGWDGWMASPTQWTWVSVNSGSWWWTGRPGVLQFMGSQRVGHDWTTELNWTERFIILCWYIIWQKQMIFKIHLF